MDKNTQIMTSLLQDDTQGIKLSIYQATHPASSSKAIQEDVIRFKNALQSVQSDDAYDKSELNDTMESLHALVEDTEFWKHRSLGLAVFADKDGYQTMSLPYDVTTACYVDEQYRLSPVVLMQSLGLDYYIFDINHTRPRLLQCTSQDCTELVIDGMPDSFESMTDDVTYTKELQHQSGGVGAFHGHDDQAAVNESMTKYDRSAADAVNDHLSGSTKPLLLIGVENRIGTMRKFLSYPHILDDYHEGSGEAMNEQELHTKTSPVMEQYYAKRRDDSVKALLETPPDQTRIGAEAIDAAAKEGRVAKLLLPCFQQTTDTVREGYDSAIVMQPEDSATESLVRSVLAQGGDVEAVAIDAFGDSQPRALCRY